MILSNYFHKYNLNKLKNIPFFFFFLFLPQMGTKINILFFFQNKENYEFFVLISKLN